MGERENLLVVRSVLKVIVLIKVCNIFFFYANLKKYSFVISLINSAADRVQEQRLSLRRQLRQFCLFMLA